MTGVVGAGRYDATVLDEPSAGHGADTTGRETEPSGVDVAAVEHEFAQIDEALARLDAGDLDGAEAITDALVGPDLVIDLTDGSRSDTDEGTPPVDTAEVPTPSTG